MTAATDVIARVRATVPATRSSRLARIGIGCGRVGSLSNPVPLAVVEETLKAAAEAGVRWFDTASVYGQGDSERALGRLFGARADIRVVTKAGLVFSRRAQIAAHAKPLLRLALKLRDAYRAKGAGTEIRAGAVGLLAIRSAEVDQDFSPPALGRSLETSLARLKRPAVDGFLLHNPSAREILDATIVRALAALKAAGSARRTGLSINHPADLEAAAAAGVYDIVQAPMTLLEAASGHAAYAKLLADGTRIHVREVLRPAGAGRFLSVPEALDRAFALPGVECVIFGISRPEHLSELLVHAD